MAQCKSGREVHGKNDIADECVNRVVAQLFRSRWRLLAPVLVFAVAGIAVVISTRPGVAQGTTIPAETAE